VLIICSSSATSSTNAKVSFYFWQFWLLLFSSWFACFWSFSEIPLFWVYSIFSSLSGLILWSESKLILLFISINSFFENPANLDRNYPLATKLILLVQSQLVFFLCFEFHHLPIGWFCRRYYWTGMFIIEEIHCSLLILSLMIGFMSWFYKIFFKLIYQYRFSQNNNFKLKL